MKAYAALLCLFPLVSSAATQIQTCTTTPTATGANQLAGCPASDLAWGPLAASDWIRVIKSGNQQGWLPFNLLTPTTQVVPRTGGWVAFGTLIVTLPAPTVLVPVQPTHLYVLTWSVVGKRMDGTVLTDLTGYIAQTGPSVAGPWGLAQTVLAPPATFVLPSSVQQCFQVVAVSQGAGASDPAVLCQPPIPTGPIKPNSPANVQVK